MSSLNSVRFLPARDHSLGPTVLSYGWRDTTKAQSPAAHRVEAPPAVSSAPPSPAETAGRQTASPNPSPPAAAPPSRKKRHTNVVAACGACRRRKSKVRTLV